MGLIDSDNAMEMIDNERAGVGQLLLAAIDIDDTLLGPDGEISRANAEAIGALRRSGVRVVLASGRSHANMLRFHHALRLGAGPVVSAQGAMVRGALTGASWFEMTAPPETVAAVTRDGLARGLAVQHYRGDGVYIQARSPWTEYDQARNDQPQVLVGAFEAMGWEDVFKVIWLGEPEDIATAALEVRRQYAGAATVTETDPGYLEFSPVGSSKAVGLTEVARRLSISREQIAAFGDGNNDVPMLTWAGLGIAMPHGRVAAREAADLVGPDGDAESALARAIELAFAGGGPAVAAGGGIDWRDVGQRETA